MSSDVRDDQPVVTDGIRRRIEQLLDEADEAIGRKDWTLVHENAEAVLALDPANPDAVGFLAAANRARPASAATTEARERPVPEPEAASERGAAEGPGPTAPSGG